MSDDEGPIRLTLDEVLDRLRYSIKVNGQADLARKLGVRDQDLSDVVHGRRPPGPMLLAAMGLRKVVTYEPIDA